MFEELERHKREVNNESYKLPHLELADLEKTYNEAWYGGEKPEDWSKAVRLTPIKFEPEPEPKVKIKEISLRNDSRLEELLEEWVELNQKPLDKSNEVK